VTTNYDIAFDLVTHPEYIQPPYFVYALFITGGSIILMFAVLKSRRNRKFAWFSTIFSIYYLGFSLIMAVYDASWVFDIRRQVESRTFHTVEGCLDVFHPGSQYTSRSTKGDEYWVVDGERFEYGTGEIRSGYHKPEAAGGSVHADSRVRVSFVPSYHSGNKEIVRLQIAPHVCPAAPNPEVS